MPRMRCRPRSGAAWPARAQRPTLVSCPRVDLLRMPGAREWPRQASRAPLRELQSAGLGGPWPDPARGSSEALRRRTPSRPGSGPPAPERQARCLGPPRGRAGQPQPSPGRAAPSAQAGVASAPASWSSSAGRPASPRLARSLPPRRAGGGSRGAPTHGRGEAALRPRRGKAAPAGASGRQTRSSSSRAEQDAPPPQVSPAGARGERGRLASSRARSGDGRAAAAAALAWGEERKGQLAASLGRAGREARAPPAPPPQLPWGWAHPLSSPCPENLMQSGGGR